MEKVPGWLLWLLSTELGRDKLSLLLLCLPTIHVLSTNLSYRLGKVHLWKPLRWVVNSWAGRWLVQVLRAAYYIGPPLAVLWRDPAILMDLLQTCTDAPLPLSLADLASSLFLGGGALMLSVAIWVWYIHTASYVKEAGNVSWWQGLREATFAQSLWVLYRNTLQTMPMDALYASVATLVIVSATWLFDPRRRDELFTPHGHLVVQEWMCAFFTACMAPVTRFWELLIPWHALWLWVGGRVRKHLLRNRSGFRADESAVHVYPVVSASGEGVRHS